MSPASVPCCGCQCLTTSQVALTGSLLWQLGRSTIQPRPLHSDMDPSQCPSHELRGCCVPGSGSWQVSGGSLQHTHLISRSSHCPSVYDAVSEDTVLPQSNFFGSKSEPAPSPSSLQTEGCLIKSGRHSPRTGPWGGAALPTTVRHLQTHVLWT